MLTNYFEGKKMGDYNRDLGEVAPLMGVSEEGLLRGGDI